MDNVCPVCLDAVDDDAHYLDCGHGFHAGCLIQWLRQGRLTCPMCRDDLRQLPGYLLKDRASYLRNTVARRRNAPRALVRCVESLRRAESECREHKRALTAFRRQHAHVIATLHRMENKHYTWCRRRRRSVQILGMYEDADTPLPALIVQDL